MKCLQIDRRRSVTLLAAALAGLGLGTPWLALAEGYPTKPIQLIVPFPPGGAVDIVGRTISKKLGDRLGQPIVIENKAGAGTVVGAAFVANAPADGYTLLISSGSTFTVNPALNAKLPNEGTLEAIRLCARQEGMLTDPVYEGKSMHGMIDMVRKGEFPEGSRVLYAHLGGVPALNAYSFLFRNG